MWLLKCSRGSKNLDSLGIHFITGISLSVLAYPPFLSGGGVGVAETPGSAAENFASILLEGMQASHDNVDLTLAILLTNDLFLLHRGADWRFLFGRFQACEAVSTWGCILC